MIMSQRNSRDQEQIIALIEAYKLEKCLYAVKSPNYHNKNLRAEALRRVTHAVSATRPGTTEKDCSTKFHNLRNQFNVENVKVKESTKSGVGTEDVYVPSLWYFRYLYYLAEHVVPRKSTASMTTKKKNRQVSQEDADQIDHSPNASSSMSSIELTEDGPLLVYEEDVDDPDKTPAHTYSLITAKTSEDNNTRLLISSSRRLSRDSSSTNILRPSTSSSQTSSTSSSIIEIPLPPNSARIPKKRKNQNDDEYVGIMASIADSLKQPIAIPNMAVSSADLVENCVGFIGSMLRGFVSEKLKLEVMQVLVQTVINARTTEFERP